MIMEYHRPKTIDSALKLLARQDLKTVPLGGGTGLSLRKNENFAVVDLQELPLAKIETQGEQIAIGATAKLQALVDCPLLPGALRNAAALDANINIRQMATVAGALVASDGRSPLSTVMVGLDAVLVWQPGEIQISLDEWLSSRSEKPGKLITQALISSDATVKAEFIGRTPVDVPFVGCAVCSWRSGRIRVAVCGFGSAPLVVLDGNMPKEIEAEIDTACSQYNKIPSFSYKLNAIKTLTQRLLGN